MRNWLGLIVRTHYLFYKVCDSCSNCQTIPIRKGVLPKAYFKVNPICPSCKNDMGVRVD